MSNVIADYGWTNTEAPPSCGYIVPNILEILKAHPNMKRVCDLGSGNGALVGKLKAAGYSACGIEYDKEGCRIACERHPGVRFYNIGVQDSPLEVTAKEGLFNAVVSTEVIEHLFSPHLLPRFARGLLEKEGMLIVSTPYHGYWKNIALSLMNKWDQHHSALWHGGHIKFFSRRTLTTLLEDNGFRVIAFHGVGRAPYLWKSMILVARAK